MSSPTQHPLESRDDPEIELQRLSDELEDQHSEFPYFGGCPQCGETNGYLNIGPHHYFVCEAHRVKWYVGANLFSCWREETEEQWQSNHVLLLGFRLVEPLRNGPPAPPRPELVKHLAGLRP